MIILARNNLKLTPIMSLAIMTIFAMMIPLFSLANDDRRAGTSKAAQATPAPTPDMMEWEMEY